MGNLEILYIEGMSPIYKDFIGTLMSNPSLVP